MPNRAKFAVVLVLVLAAAAAAARAAEQPVTVRVGDLRLTFNGGIVPKALPRDELTPVGFWASGEIGNADGSHPSALREFVLDADRDVSFDVSGLPACRGSQLQSQDSRHARAICGGAIIGKGLGKVEISFPEQAPIPATSPLTIFNGGVRGGVTTLYVHIYVTVPAPTAVVTTVKITRIHDGRFGLRSVASVPRIAGGSGSVTYFSFAIGRSLTVHGDRHSVLRARCPDGHIQARSLAVFEDGTRGAADVIRTCVPKR